MLFAFLEAVAVGFFGFSSGTSISSISTSSISSFTIGSSTWTVFSGGAALDPFEVVDPLLDPDFAGVDFFGVGGLIVSETSSVSDLPRLVGRGFEGEEVLDRLTGVPCLAGVTFLAGVAFFTGVADFSGVLETIESLTRLGLLP